MSHIWEFLSDKPKHPLVPNFLINKGHINLSKNKVLSRYRMRLKTNILKASYSNEDKKLNHTLCWDWSCSTIHTVVTWHSKTFVNDLLSKILKKSIRVENDKTSPGKLFKVLSSSHSTYEVATANIARFLILCATM